MKSPLLYNCSTLRRRVFGVGNGSINLEILDEGQDTECFIMYDIGRKSQLREVFRNNKVLFERIKEKGIETLFISHFDDDHVGGLNYLKNDLEIKVRNCFIPFSDKMAASTDILKYIVTGRKKYNAEQFEWLKDVLYAREYSYFEFSDKEYRSDDEFNDETTRFIYWGVEEPTEWIYTNKKYNYKLMPFTYSVQYDPPLLKNYNDKILACLQSISPLIKSLNPKEIAENLDIIIKSLSNSNNKKNLKKLLNTSIYPKQLSTDKYSHANSLLLRSDFLKDGNIKYRRCLQCYYCCCCDYCDLMKNIMYHHQWNKINEKSVFFYTGDANFSDAYFDEKWKYVAKKSTEDGKINIDYITIPHHGSYHSSGMKFYNYYSDSDKIYESKFILQTGKSYKSSINKLIDDLNLKLIYKRVVGGVFCDTQIISCVGLKCDLILSDSKIGAKIEKIGDKPY